MPLPTETPHSAADAGSDCAPARHSAVAHAMPLDARDMALPGTAGPIVAVVITVPVVAVEDAAFLAIEHKRNRPVRLQLCQRLFGSRARRLVGAYHEQHQVGPLGEISCLR